MVMFLYELCCDIHAARHNGQYGSMLGVVFHVPLVRLTSGQASAVKMPARDVVPKSTVLELGIWVWHIV